MIFKDRTEAGRLLAQELVDYRGQDIVVLALPRGGVPVAREVAGYLEAPMDLLLVRKLGVPLQPELAMGAVMDGSPPVVVRNEGVIRQALISEDDFAAVRDLELEEIGRRRDLYLAGRPPVGLAGRIAVIVDDGVATGATVKAAIEGLRNLRPAEIVVAIPVGPPDAVAEIGRLADRVICLEEPESFGAIGFFYRDFHQLSDADVVAALESERQETLKEGSK